MRLGLNLGYWGAGNDADNLALAREADRLGYSVAWAAEAYGSDAATVLAWVAAQTERIDVGSAIFQIPARTPAMTAMTAATLDTLSGGRFRLGLGVSGPQVSEGWHGVRFDHPLARTREYVDIVNLALCPQAGRVRRRSTGRCRCRTGPGKALRLTVHPVREHDPDLPGRRSGPKNLELTGEIADGWLAIFFSPEHAAPVAGRRAGRPGARPAAARMTTGWPDSTSYQRFPSSSTTTSSGPPSRCAPYAALYVGGMGSRKQNFYNALAVRMGYEREAREVQDLFLDRKHRDAAAAVPLKFIDQTSLIGPRDRIRDRLAGLRRGGRHHPDGRGLPRRPGPAGCRPLRTMAELLDESGLGEGA